MSLVLTIECVFEPRSRFKIEIEPNQQQTCPNHPGCREAVTLKCSSYVGEGTSCTSDGCVLDILCRVCFALQNWARSLIFLIACLCINLNWALKNCDQDLINDSQMTPWPQLHLIILEFGVTSSDLKTCVYNQISFLGNGLCLYIGYVFNPNVHLSNFRKN